MGYKVKTNNTEIETLLLDELNTFGLSIEMPDEDESILLNINNTNKGKNKTTEVINNKKNNKKSQ